MVIERERQNSLIVVKLKTLAAVGDVHRGLVKCELTVVLNSAENKLAFSVSFKGHAEFLALFDNVAV